MNIVPGPLIADQWPGGPKALLHTSPVQRTGFRSKSDQGLKVRRTFGWMRRAVGPEKPFLPNPVRWTGLVCDQAFGPALHQSARAIPVFRLDFQSGWCAAFTEQGVDGSHQRRPIVVLGAPLTRQRNAAGTAAPSRE